MHKIIKASGLEERFDPKKVYFTCLNAGASKELAKETSLLVKNKYFPGMDTKEILKIILQNLKKEPGVSQRYDLKRAIMSLGPSGFPFEYYFARILNHYNYETKVDNIVKGKRILHEVDIIAKKESKSYMIECKYHNFVGTNTKLHPAMYTYARFLDVNKFDIPWLATNTKIVKDAIEYAKGVNMKLTSWSYPEKESLKILIEKNNLFPITSATAIRKETIEKLLTENIVLAKDFLNFTNQELIKKTNLTEKEIEKIKKEIKEITKQKF